METVDNPVFYLCNAPDPNIRFVEPTSVSVDDVCRKLVGSTEIMWYERQFLYYTLMIWKKICTTAEVWEGSGYKLTSPLIYDGVSNFQSWNVEVPHTSGLQGGLKTLVHVIPDDEWSPMEICWMHFVDEFGLDEWDWECWWGEINSSRSLQVWPEARKSAWSCKIGGLIRVLLSNFYEE